jgi:CHAT domain-containing protein
MQLSMGYDRIDGKKLFFLLCTLFLGITLQAQNQDFSRVKSKYDFKTEATEKLSELVTAKKYDEALSFANEKIDKASKNGQYEELVLLLERKADLFRRLQQFEEGEITATDAIKIARERLGQKHILVAQLYLTKGIIQHRKTDFYTASSNFDTAQVAYENAVQYDSSMYNKILDYKYYAYTYSERNSDTLKKYLDIRYNYLLNNPKSTPHDIIYLKDDFPRLYRELGDFGQALAYSIEAVIYANENIDEIESNDHTSAYFNLIYTLYFMKKYDLALNICNDVLKLYLKNEKYYKSLNINDILALRPLLLVKIGDFKKAIVLYQNLIDDLKNTSKQNEIKFLYELKINLAYCYINTGQFDLAKKNLDQALNMIQTTNKPPDKQLASLYSTQGNYFELKKDFSHALYSYDSALKNSIPEYFTDNILEFPVLQDQKISFNVLLELKKKAISLNKLFQNDLRDSLTLLTSVNDYVLGTHQVIIERRKELMRTEGRLFLSNNFKSLYENGILSSYLLTVNGRVEEGTKHASQFFQMSKSVLFLEQAGEFEEINSAGVSQFLRTRFYNLNKEVGNMNKEFYSKFSQKNLLSDSIKHMNARLLESSKKLADLKDSINTSIDNIIAPLPSGSDSFSFKTDNILSIEFFVGDSTIYTLGRTKDKVILERGALDSLFYKSIENVIKEVSNRPNFSNYNDRISEFIESSHLLYQRLLLPILQQLEHKPKYITIIPDEFLSRLPFEVLLTEGVTNNPTFKNLPYLINDYSINYRLTSAENKDAIPKTATKNILGIGYSQEEKRGDRLGLPGTGQEIKQLQSKFNGEYYLGQEATKALFLTEAKDFDVLHLAVHGETDKYGKYDARLIFNGTDSILNTSDLYMAGLKARLVVLSACESGTGEVIGGEGTFSIARGFALVGSPSIIMSLWNVNDKVSSAIMFDLYEFLSNGYTTSESLNRSKLSYLQRSDNYTSHPYYWSSFVSLGSPVELYPSPKSLNLTTIKWFILIVLIIIASLFFTIHNKKRRRIRN